MPVDSATPHHGFPTLTRIRQNLPAEALPDVTATVARQLAALAPALPELTGRTVGITAGSRGIDRIVDILRTIVQVVRQRGGQPVVLPAMGSHGGGTAGGQMEVLDGLGITAASVRAPIQPCPESVELGRTPEGYPVWCNRLAERMDHLVVVNRIKKHTDYTGRIESGLHKMMAIGLGGPRGADEAHRLAVADGYETVITAIGRAMLDRLPVWCGLAVVENWKNRVARIEALKPGAIPVREPALLAWQKAGSIKLPFERLNVLVVRRIGKDISGGGMDTNVVGRMRLLGTPEPQRPAIERIVVLGLTPASRGNALGLGLADFTTRRVFAAVDPVKTAFNCVTGFSPEHAAIPCTLENDREAIRAAIRTSRTPAPARVRLVVIDNTSQLEHLAVSEVLIEEVRRDPHLAIAAPAAPMTFDGDGNLVSATG